MPLRSGVQRLLHEARAVGIRLAIATTATRESVLELLDHADTPSLRDWFEVIVAGDAVAHKKPAPDIYRLALAELDLEAADCVAIEDSDHGARAALAAGIRAVLITVNDETLGQDFGAAPLVEWSEMNGFGAELGSWSLFMACWTALAMVLSVMTIGAWPRGRRALPARRGIAAGGLARVAEPHRHLCDPGGIVEGGFVETQPAPQPVTAVLALA